MTQTSKHAYGFPEAVPLESVDPGTNLLVSGPSARGARELALRLVVPPTLSNDGLLLLSADVPGRALLERCEEVGPAVDRERLGIVDATGTGTDEHRRFGTTGEPIDDPGELNRIAMELSQLYESVVREGVEGVRIGVFSLSSMLVHAPQREVSRFVHMLSGRVIATDDLGVFLVDSTADDERVVDGVAGFCDGRIEVRSADGGEHAFEARVEGLEGHDGSWEPFEVDGTAEDAAAGETETWSE